MLICLVSDGKITKSALKVISGEFDLESIHTLMLRDSGIVWYYNRKVIRILNTKASEAQSDDHVPNYIHLCINDA